MPWAKSRPRRTSNVAQGYGAEHKKLRAKLLPTAYGTACYRCGQLMLPGQKLHLDHTDDRSGYGGFSHSVCNLKAAARKGQRMRTMRKRRRSLSVMDSSREW